MDEIILDRKGNTYVGSLAQRFATGELEIPKVHHLGGESFHVFEVSEDGRVIYRAGQSTVRGARSYMQENRVLVYWRKAIEADEAYEALMNGETHL